MKIQRLSIPPTTGAILKREIRNINEAVTIHLSIRLWLVSLADLPATILSAAGISVPDYYQGVAVQDDSERNCVFVQISESQCGRAIRTKRYTYSVTSKKILSSHSSIYFEDFLYDNEKDPAQKNNLIKSKEYNGVKTEMKNLLLEQIEKIEGKRPKILPCIYAKRK